LGTERTPLLASGSLGFRSEREDVESLEMPGS
jgi:hypothetical protein